MKSIFSKTGNKKDVSGKLERRTTSNPPNQAVVSPSTGRVNSFIPTPATYSHSNGHMNGHPPGKQLSQPALAPQQQQQQMSHIMSQQQQQHHNHFYSNIPPGNPNANNNANNANNGGTVSRMDHHYTTYQQQQSIHQSHQQQIHQRTLTKSYSSSQHQNHNHQSHYGNTTLYASNNSASHGTTFYGNTTNLANGAIIMNGHHGISGGERSDAMGQVHSSNNNNNNNMQSSSYNHEQVQHHHHQQQQQMQTQQTIQKMHVHPQQRGVHHHKQQPQLNFQQNNHLHNNNNVIPPPSNATDGLPPPLVDSMRTLFDILDDSKQGKIRLSDIETRWESDSNNGGPNGKATGAEPLIKMGVLEYLRKVTPGDGMLTFDRFCSGLRLALLTNNGDPFDEHVPIMQSEKVQANHPQSQHYFQEQVRNMTNVSKPIHNNQVGQPPPPPPAQLHQQQQQLVFSGNPINNSNSNAPLNKSTLSGAAPGQSNTISRLSKIPNFSSSRLPMPSSGIALSPTNRANTIPMVNNNNNKGSHVLTHHHHSHHNGNNGGTLISGTKRFPTNNSEQNTTIALVHPQPPPNPKPTGNGTSSGMPMPTSSYSTIGGGTMKGNKTTSGFLNRFSSKNSSLDDLQVHNDESNSSSVQKERPPSAPILDNDDEPQTRLAHESHHHQLTKQKIRERAKSQERDRVVNNNANTNNSNHISRAEEKSNFVKSRQRTLSMPQLQLNKLKPQQSVNFDESSSSMDPSPVENYPRPSTLKNHSLSKLLAGGHQYGSSIPSPLSATTNTLKHPTTTSSTNKADDNNRQHEKEPQGDNLPPPPPKPPRNTMSGPVTISTTLISGLNQDPPLSGSSFGSGQSSSATTISVSASSTSGNLSAKPEIRNVLNSWQKGLSDKKPVKPSLSSTSIGTNSSVNTVNTIETSQSVPTATILLNGVTKMSNGSTTIDDVKLRQPTKSNLKRKETSRRHTVQSGIDFSTLKRLKQLEQERDVLQQGIQFLEKASEWYMKQLETSNDKITLLGKGAPTSDYWSESHEERLNLLGCRITEVNSLLTSLMDGNSQYDPLHMNLQIPSHLSLRTITRLKDQNRQLTQEVSDYSHRVTQLENEKAMLLRQLFHQKNNNSASDETVYM